MMKSLVFFSMMLLSGLAFSQTGNVQGTVLDKESEDQPLAFAEVRVKGLDLSTRTDLSGRYSLNLLPGTYTLLVDFIGYETKEIKNIEVESKVSAKELGELLLESRKRPADLTLASSE